MCQRFNKDCTCLHNKLFVIQLIVLMVIGIILIINMIVDVIVLMKKVDHVGQEVQNTKIVLEHINESLQEFELVEEDEIPQ